MNNELISIIVPVYNLEKYISSCLDTLIKQTYENIEIIIINDGSTDKSLEIVQEYKTKDDRIIIINQDNHGISYVRNVGLDNVNGEYIMFVDGDDLVSTSIVETLYKTIITTNADASMCGTNHIFDLTNIHYHIDEEIDVVPGMEYVKDLWYQKLYIPSVWGKLYKKEVFAGERFIDGIIFEDVDILYRVMYPLDRISYIHSELYGYVHHENSITTNTFSKNEFNILDVARRMISFAKEHRELQAAAMSYLVTCALRLYLNMPETYAKEKVQVKAIIDKHGKTVLKDKNIRKKNKYALILYFYFKPLMKPVYRRINRWK